MRGRDRQRFSPVVEYETVTPAGTPSSSVEDDWTANETFHAAPESVSAASSAQREGLNRELNRKAAEKGRSRAGWAVEAEEW
ncbi:hypothetical protein ABTA67_19935, partial [Acinetobacter baumannii]